MEKYVITKSLTKQPEAYPDGKNQPHVQVSIWQFYTAEKPRVASY